MIGREFISTIRMATTIQNRSTCHSVSFDISAALFLPAHRVLDSDFAVTMFITIMVSACLLAVLNGILVCNILMRIIGSHRLYNQGLILKMQLGGDCSNFKKQEQVDFRLFMEQFLDHIFHCAFLIFSRKTCFLTVS